MGPLGTGEMNLGPGLLSRLPRMRKGFLTRECGQHPSTPHSSQWRVRRCLDSTDIECAAVAWALMA
eukprot:935763-Pyramimonas_sp.AAC.1